MIEQWKDIPSYADFEISNFGRVRTKERMVKANGCGQMRLIPSRDIKIRLSDTAAVVSLRQDGRESTKSIKRLVWQAFGNQQIITSQKVTNIDGDIANNAIDNLSIFVAKTSNEKRLQYERERVRKKKEETYVHPTIGDIYGCARIGNQLLRMAWR